MGGLLAGLLGQCAWVGVRKSTSSAWYFSARGQGWPRQWTLQVLAHVLLVHGIVVLWRFVIAGGGNNDVGTQLQAALLSMCGKPVRELAHVDLGEKLAELGLARHFPDEVWL